MVRPREFDPDAALKGATDIFWRQGFKATNLPDLLGAMGLTRGSFYKAFHDKKSVYLDALDHYDQTVVSGTVRKLQSCQKNSAAECLAPLFEGGPADRRGCLICNAMVELAPDHADVAEKANLMADRLRKAIEGVLHRFETTGSTGDAARTADLILHLYFGHQAIGKAGHPSREWQAHLDRLL